LLFGLDLNVFWLIVFLKLHNARCSRRIKNPHFFAQRLLFFHRRKSVSGAVLACRLAGLFSK
jgi:hypothetical protein